MIYFRGSNIILIEFMFTWPEASLKALSVHNLRKVEYENPLNCLLEQLEDDIKLNELSRLLKGPLLGLRQFLPTGSSLIMMKNAFCFMLTALFVHMLFKCRSWLFGHLGKQLDEKSKIKLEIADVTANK